MGEKVVEVPQVQMAEVVRQDLQPVIQEVIKEIPKFQVEYVEKVVEVQSQLMQEQTTRQGFVQQERGFVQQGQRPVGSALVAPFQQSFLQEPVSMNTSSVLPGAVVGLDLNRDGRADMMVVGTDFNRDGIPDALQQGGSLLFGGT